MSKSKFSILVGSVFLFAFTAGFTVKGFLFSHANSSRASASSTPLPFAGVPDVRQSTNYSCGASALQAVLAYWGIEAREDVIMKACRTTPEDGTQPAGILRVARSYGLRAEMKEGCTVEDLKHALDRGIPAIVDIQAWTEAPAAGFSWSSDWEDGHYVVAVGIDKDNLYVEDPSLLGSRGIIPLNEFVNRWHDYEGAPPFDPSDRSYVHMAIFIEGSKKAEVLPFRAVQ